MQQPSQVVQNYVYTTDEITDEQRLAFPLTLGRLANLADCATGKATMSDEHWVRQARKNGWKVRA
jgi:hypothetical protein